MQLLYFIDVYLLFWQMPYFVHKDLIRSQSILIYRLQL